MKRQSVVTLSFGISTDGTFLGAINGMPLADLEAKSVEACNRLSQVAAIHFQRTMVSVQRGAVSFPRNPLDV